MKVRTVINILYLICSVCWIIYCSKDYKKNKVNENITDEERKSNAKKNKTLIVLWAVIAVLSVAALIFDFTGLGDVPIF